LRQLRRTCDSLTEFGIDASAVIIADRPNLRDLGGRIGHDLLGFSSVERGNEFVSKKFNDGIQLACDPRHNHKPVDYVVPCGSDDWVDWQIFKHLPPHDTIMGFQHISFVREDGTEMTSRFLNYPGGCGIRVYPRRLLEQSDYRYRPCDESRKRGCDTSILYNLQSTIPNLKLLHQPVDPRQIVDWKTAGVQLNSYEDLRRHKKVGTDDPFDVLASIYPAEALEEMAVHYGRVPVAA
jgi:hypothetical protein